MTDIEQATLALDTARTRCMEASRVLREALIALHRAEERYYEVREKIALESLYRYDHHA